MFANWGKGFGTQGDLDSRVLGTCVVGNYMVTATYYIEYASILELVVQNTSNGTLVRTTRITLPTGFFINEQTFDHEKNESTSMIPIAGTEIFGHIKVYDTVGLSYVTFRFNYNVTSGVVYADVETFMSRGTPANPTSILYDGQNTFRTGLTNWSQGGVRYGWGYINWGSGTSEISDYPGNNSGAVVMFGKNSNNQPFRPYGVGVYAPATLWVAGMLGDGVNTFYPAFGDYYLGYGNFHTCWYNPTMTGWIPRVTKMIGSELYVVFRRGESLYGNADQDSGVIVAKFYNPAGAYAFEGGMQCAWATLISTYHASDEAGYVSSGGAALQGRRQQSLQYVNGVIEVSFNVILDNFDRRYNAMQFFTLDLNGTVLGGKRLRIEPSGGLNTSDALYNIFTGPLAHRTSTHWHMALPLYNTYPGSSSSAHKVTTHKWDGGSATRNTTFVFSQLTSWLAQDYTFAFNLNTAPLPAITAYPGSYMPTIGTVTSYSTFATPFDNMY